MRSFPQSWRADKGWMERTCPHGIGHPDPDDPFADPIHGCDGCCNPQWDGAFRDLLDTPDYDAPEITKVTLNKRSVSIFYTKNEENYQFIFSFLLEKEPAKFTKWVNKETLLANAFVKYITLEPTEDGFAFVFLTEHETFGVMESKLLVEIFEDLTQVFPVFHSVVYPVK